MKNKIALFPNKDGKVVKIHYKPEMLSEESLVDSILVDKSDARLEKPNIEDYKKATLHIYDGSPYWEIGVLKVLSVLKYKLKIQLKREELLDQVEQLIQGNDEMLIAWNDSAEISRVSNFLVSIASELGLSEERIDEIFAKANLIEL